MNRSFHPANWWKIIAGGLAGAALASGSPWVSRGSQQAAQSPLSEKFWPSEFGSDDRAVLRTGSHPRRSNPRRSS